MTVDEEDGPERWVDQHGDGLYRYALLRLRSPDLAADLVQETFLEALRANSAFQGRSAERTWLVGILRHKILDHFRRTGRERVRAGAAATNGFAVEPGGGPAFDSRGHWKNGPASWRGEPSRDMESREFWEIFGGCLAGLPPTLADAFFLRELVGLSALEVQDVLGITPANLWTRLHRARGLLRECLETRWLGRRSMSATTASPSPTAKGPSRP